MSEERLKIDELVVGAGLTGLVYANVAAAHGRRVAVVEKHTKPGGYATNFDRKRKFVFDCSLHKITGFGPRGNLEDALERAGLMQHIDFHYYDELTTFLIGDRRIVLPCDGERLFDELARQFPHERAALARFRADVGSYGYQTYMLARVALGEHQLDMESFAESRRLARMTAFAYFTDLFADRQLITLLCSLAINLGVEAMEADALYFLHFAYTFMLTRKAYVKGSSQYLSDTLARQLERRGGTLLLGERLLGIEVAGGQVAGAHTRRRRFETDHIVFTGCPHHVLELLPPAVGADDFRKKLDKLEFGLGAFIVYLGLSAPPAAIGMLQSDYLVADEAYLDGAGGEANCPLRYQRRPLSISNYHALDPTYGYVVQLEILEQQDDWLDLPREAYKEKKRDIAEQVIDRACRYFPQLRGAIEYMDISTPRTNKKYTNSGGGSSFGYKPVPKRNVSFLKSPPVDGIQFVGTWVNGAGYEPAMCLGFTAATLRHHKLIEQNQSRGHTEHGSTSGSTAGNTSSRTEEAAPVFAD